jgi:hypothetical protein
VKYQERLGELLQDTKKIEGSSPCQTKYLNWTEPYDPFVARRARSITAESLQVLINKDPLREILIDWGTTSSANKRGARLGVTHKEIMAYLTLAFLEFGPISASYPVSDVQRNDDGTVKLDAE